GVLAGGGRSGDQGVLTVVDRVGISVRETEIGAVGHAAIDGESCAIIDARGGALEFVDRAELGDGASEGIDTGRKRTGERLSVLPGGEGIDGVVTVLEDGTGGIEERVIDGG